MTAVAPAHARPVAGLPRREAARLAGVVVVAGALAVLSLWWRDPSTRTVHSTGDLLVQVGRATGLLAAYLLLLQVLLMARLPVLESRIGADWLARAHRWVGCYLTCLVAVHVGAVVLGYAATDHARVTAEATTLVLGYPDVLLATVGTALLALVVAVSAAALRPAFRYETWYGVHLLGYLAVGLVFTHQLANGAQFVTDPVARQAWIGVHVLVLLLLVRYRLVEPVRLYRRHRFRVDDVAVEPDGSVSVYVVGRDLDRLRVLPGQFFRWRFLTGGHWYQAHPFSLSEAPNGRWLRMTAKPVGDHTSGLRDLMPDTPVLLEGPYGALTPRAARLAPLLLVAGGSGIAPLLALLQDAAVSGRPATLLYRVRDRDTAPFLDELATLAGTDGIEVVVLDGPRGHGRAGDPFHPTRLRALVPDVRDREVYLCGPDGLVHHVQEALGVLGVTSQHVHHESFTL